MLAELVHSQNKYWMLSFPYSNTSLGRTTTKLPTVKQAEEESRCDRRGKCILKVHWYIKKKKKITSRVKSLNKCGCHNNHNHYWHTWSLKLTGWSRGETTVHEQKKNFKNFSSLSGKFQLYKCTLAFKIINVLFCSQSSSHGTKKSVSFSPKLGIWEAFQTVKTRKQPHGKWYPARRMWKWAWWCGEDIDGGGGRNFKPYTCG